MSSLTEISVTIRKLFIWLGILLAAYLAVKLLISFGARYWKPPTTISIPPPDVRFGKLSKPKFSHIATSSSGLKFTLENIEGRPPETTAAGKVYSMPKKFPTFLSAERAKKVANKLGFTEEPEIITSTYYRFTDPQDKLRTLDLDIINLNFKLKYDYTQKPQLFAHGQTLTRERTISDVKNFIRSNNLFDESILGGIISTDLLIFDPTTKTFSSASSLSVTNAIRINFIREDIDGLKVLPPKYNQSFNYALYTVSAPINTQIIDLSYTFWPIDFGNFGTYPLRNAATAWQDLIDGYAYVVNMGNNSPDKIVIRDIFLAYYDSEEPQSFLTPIFVFEGDNDFIAYLPAVAAEWLE